MKKVKFLRISNMTYVYLDDSIFKNDVNKINVTTCIFHIFSIKERQIRASAFIDDGDDFLNSIQHIIARDSIKIVGNSKNSRGYVGFLIVRVGIFCII